MKSRIIFSRGKNPPVNEYTLEIKTNPPHDKPILVPAHVYCVAKDQWSLWIKLPTRIRMTYVETWWDRKPTEKQIIKILADLSWPKYWLEADFYLYKWRKRGRKGIDSE